MIRVRRVALATAALLAGAAAPPLSSSAWAQEARQIRPLPQAAQQAAQQAAPQTGQAVVSATSGWTPTNVSVRNGARLQVAAQGRWTLSQSVTAAPPVSGPDGVVGRTDPRAPLANAPLGALIGRIGANGKPFLVGANYDATAAADGELFLAINENAAALADNSGRIAASVTMRPAATTPTITRPLRDLTAVIPPRVTTPPQTKTPGTTTQQPPSRAPVQSTIPVQSTTRPTTQPPATRTPATQTPPTRTPPTQQTPPATNVPGTRTPPTQTPPTATPPVTRDPPTRVPPSTQQPPTTRPPQQQPPSTQQPPTTRPPTRVPVDPTTGAPKEPERPPEQPPTTQTPTPETPPTPTSDTPPVVEQTPPVQTTPIEPPAIVPAPPPASPASPIVPILAVILGLGVLATFGLRAGGKKKPSQDDPASAPRISARVSADGRSNQELSVSFRGRA